jgi:hypothetical protein
MPTSVQELLLVAALGSPDEQLAAWRSWRAVTDINSLDAGSYRILPLVWRRLARRAVDDVAMATLKGVYRRTWYQNQILLHRASRLLANLHAHGIETLLLKGAALTLLHYRDAGVRPMDDFDILVPRRQAGAVVDLLFGWGWVAEVTPLKRYGTDEPGGGRSWPWGRRAQAAFGQAYFDVRHAHGFVSRENTRVDLHWRVLQEEHAADVDDTFWRAAVAVDLEAVETLALEPADQLLHACIHAVGWNRVPSIRWVADAEAIVRSAGDSLNWNRLVSQARSLAITLPLSRMLDYLSSRFAIPVSAAALEELDAEPVEEAARRAYRIKVAPPGLRAGWEELRYLRRRYHTLRRDLSLRPSLGSFPRFVARIIGADHPARVGAYAVTESLRRLRQRLIRAD